MKKFKLLLTMLFSLGLIVSCSGDGEKDNSSSSDTTEVRTELTTEVTDATKLSETSIYEGKTFTEDGIGKATYVRHIDGDTTWFNDGKEEFSLRYYGVNTPESTARIEPWGLSASKFTKEKIKAASDIVLEQDAAEKQTGNRYLGLVWLKEPGMTDYYCLNLLLVEQAYTENLLLDKESKYFDAFQQAGKNAKATKKRIYGEKDPTFDYSKTAINVTVDQIYDDFDTLRQSGKQLIVHGIITSLVPDGFYIRSIEPVEGKFKYIYCYTQGQTLGPKFPVGSALKFYAKAGEFGGNPQLTDVEYSSIGKHKPVLLDEENHVTEEIKITSKTTEAEYKEALYAPVTAELLVVKKGKPSKNSGDFTIYCKYRDNPSVEMNIRVAAEQEVYYKDFFVANKVIRVKGVLNLFTVDADDPNSDFSYQIVLRTTNADDLDIEEI